MKVFSHDFLKYKVVDNEKYKKQHSHQTLATKEGGNLVYRHMKTQKIIASVFESMYSKGDQKRRSKSQMSHDNNLSKSKIAKSERNPANYEKHYYSRSYSLKKEQTSRQISKVKHFNESLKNFQHGIEKSKEKFRILNKYNKVSQTYEEMIPRDPAEETRQSLEEKQVLLALCKEDFLPKKTNLDFHNKAQRIKKYKEPFITNQVKKEFIKRRRMANSPIKEIRKLIKQQLKTIDSNFQEQ